MGVGRRAGATGTRTRHLSADLTPSESGDEGTVLRLEAVTKRYGTFTAVDGIDLTPLIDVSLVLVVMLLLATPLAFESSASATVLYASGSHSSSNLSPSRRTSSAPFSNAISMSCSSST